MIESYLIMAAGNSSRMKPLTNNIPKGLLPLGDSTLIHRLIQQFGQLSKKVIVGTGCLENVLRESLPTEVETRFFPKYASQNNFFTLKSMRDILARESLISFADIFVDDEIQTQIANKILQGKSFAVVDTSQVLESTMGVRVINNLLCEICDANTKYLANGNFVGIAFFDRADAQLLSGALGSLQNVPDNSYFTFALEHLLRSGLNFDVVDVAGHYWAEVDTPQEFERLVSYVEGLI